MRKNIQNSNWQASGSKTAEEICVLSMGFAFFLKFGFWRLPGVSSYQSNCSKNETFRQKNWLKIFGERFGVGGRRKAFVEAGSCRYFGARNKRLRLVYEFEEFHIKENQEIAKIQKKSSE